MTAPVLAVDDGALGFWKALREVFPATREQRCWFHVSSNVLAAMPKSAHPGAKAALAEIYNAEDREHALQAVKAFDTDYGAKWPKAVAKVTEHIDVLLAFYDYPAQHWIHVRTTSSSVKVKSFAARSRSGAISQPTMRSLTGISRAWSRLDFLRDSSSSLHDGAGLPAPICSRRQRS
jgi:transposase-like protein